MTLFAGGHGGSQMAPDCKMAWGNGNFLVRSRKLFAEQGRIVVVHHERDGCASCLFADMPVLMRPLKANLPHELITLKGGQSTGDPCEAQAYQGFNGLEVDLAKRVAQWVLAK